MNIFINERPAEITLDSEKTLGEVMAGIEQWISPSGNRIQRIYVNGTEIAENTLSEAFCMAIDDIEKLDIFVSSWRELASEAIEILCETCVAHMNSDFEERAQIYASWGKSSAARFLNTDMSDIYFLAANTLSGNGLSVADFIFVLEERLRELEDPAQEINNSEERVNAIAERMEELPLDLQTGKDQRAAETVQLFTQMGEKLFRIFFIYTSEGLSTETFVIDDLPAKTFMEEFNSALRELIKAYENRDTVLAGDISEYELAPRLLKFFSALKKKAKSDFPVLAGL